ncbi:MAG: nicotinate (nicotinamide) nucleotide adenylyltransferase [Caulobacterales bacterium]
MPRGIPPAYPRQRIGLFGGSFDPAHEGHGHVAETALKRLHLDHVWWLVTPQNPLKAESAPLAQRVASARKMARGAKMKVTAFEAPHSFRYTYQTIAALKRWFPQTEFVLIVGADSLRNFRHWRRWREILRAVPLAIIARPRAGIKALAAKPAQVFAQARRGAGAKRTPPAWVFLNARLHPQSSTMLRERNQGY